MKKSIIVGLVILIAIATGIVYEKRVVKFSPEKIKSIEIHRRNNTYIVNNHKYIEELCLALKLNNSEFINTNIYGYSTSTIIKFKVNNNEEVLYTSESENNIYRLVSGNIGVKTENKEFHDLLDEITKQ